MSKVVSGYCPLQKINYSVKFDIVKTGTFDNPNSYELGMPDCDYAGIRHCEFIKDNQCPIVNSTK